MIDLGQTGPGEPPEDGEMNEMTLPFRHKNKKINSVCKLRD